MRSIGDSYANATGQTYPLLVQTRDVQKRTQTVWERVKEALAEKRLPDTQKYVAEKVLHIRQPSISDWNKPGGYPTMENAVRLSEYLDISVEWLLTGRGPKYVPGDDPESDALHRLWRGMDGMARSRLLAHAQILATPLPDEPKTSSSTARRTKILP